MEKFEILDAMVDRGNGYLLTSAVVKEGISKPTLASYVRYKSMERVGRGIYLSDSEWPDELYLRNESCCLTRTDRIGERLNGSREW